MKRAESSEKGIIRDEGELKSRFLALLSEDPDLRWQPLPRAQENLIEVELDQQKMLLWPVYQLKPSLSSLVRVKRAPGDPPPLIVTPQLTPRVLEACKQQGLAAMDLNGRCWLRAPGVLIDRRALPGRSFTSYLEPRNVFVGKSARIIRCLLTDRDRLWTQAEIGPRTQASSGLISRIIQHLISQGFVEKTSAREFRLRDPLALLDEWADADRFSKRNYTGLYAGFSAPEEMAHRLQQWAREEAVPMALTQWMAAWLRHPTTEPVVCSAYVSRLPEAATLERLGLRQVSEGGKLWLHVPADEGVLMETQTRHHLTLVSDAQIYLDLQRMGLRGPDAAAALREWTGFCRP
ncbi:transcriptional regulator with AbiEi antitoxin domain of type IV toxin-antitoxin system [Prosthecobacter fusiformis]|uniref:Transcriptional regulator with AbiEi antitoxin domain of type IV toxin-antitoxin system n=1 Tax=Prosthecobacter fusiformis TaxID=48464 RepID=A0A4R7RJ60_9BACT|nr:type IV toxin-antitoxin system AbiEi family antitoxin [Prosthecobacter fusiformis]TDU64148.1 transcriptional regulator with AbiEi antitoxin domain of type IV toxin-antitoxin system [Prosthecobacter fusiformis]